LEAAFVPCHGKTRAQKRVARTTLHVVIAGLDPAIHAQLPLLRFAVVLCFRLVSMDHRVKPGGDDKRDTRRVNDEALALLT
jgi:hypothetical protein